MNSLATKSDGFCVITSDGTSTRPPVTYRSYWNDRLLERPPANILSLLSEFENYSDGWHFGEGIAFPPDVIKRAKCISAMAAAMGYEDQGVAPGTSGDVQLSLFIGNQIEIEIFVEPSGIITALVYEDGDYTDEDFGTSEMEEVRQWLSLFESFTRDTFTRKSPGSQALHYSLHPVQTRGFPCLV